MRITQRVQYLHDPVYRVSFIVVCSAAKDFRPTVARTLLTTTATAAQRRAILRALDLSMEEAWYTCYGRCFRLDPPNGTGGTLPFVVVWVQPREGNVATLVHELWHAAYWVFRERGVRFDSGMGADEPMAYYLSWLTERVLAG